MAGIQNGLDEIVDMQRLDEMPSAAGQGEDGPSLDKVDQAADVSIVSAAVDHGGAEHDPPWGAVDERLLGGDDAEGGGVGPLGEAAHGGEADDPHDARGVGSLHHRGREADVGQMADDRASLEGAVEGLAVLAPGLTGFGQPAGNEVEAGEVALGLAGEEDDMVAHLPEARHDALAGV